MSYLYFARIDNQFFSEKAEENFRFGGIFYRVVCSTNVKE
jgi:hypothetical protein